MADDTKEPPKDRRQISRVSLNQPLPARLRMAADAFIRNLSAGGALIESGRALAPGSSCEVHVQHEGATVVVKARVVRCHLLGGSGSRYESGLEFEEIDENTRSAIEKIVKSSRDGEPVPGRIKA